jgi:polysaccharide biosynthesis protein VpsQ
MKWLAILFTFFIILIIVLADMGKLGTLFLTRIPYADKAGHFILYGILALLINLSLFRSLPLRSWKWVVVVSSLMLALLIGLEEFSQQYFPNRTFSLSDLTASYLGVIFFSWLATRTKHTHD